MKTFFLMLFISTIAHGQISANLGLTSRMQGTGKLAIEKQVSWNNTEAGASISSDNMHPVMSLQTGYSTTNEFQCANYRFMIGAFYHTGILPVDKEKREQQIRFGGSARLELNHGLVQLGYDGETVNLTLGFSFKRRP